MNVKLLLCAAEVGDDGIKIQFLDRSLPHRRLGEEVVQYGVAPRSMGEQEAASAERSQNGFCDAGSTQRCKGGKLVLPTPLL